MSLKYHHNETPPIGDHCLLNVTGVPTELTLNIRIRVVKVRISAKIMSNLNTVVHGLSFILNAVILP
jgi:hypothetical protein